MVFDSFLDLAIRLALAMLSMSFLITVIRVIRGPTLPDRILALDMLVAVAIGFIAVIGIMTGYKLYLDIAIALGLVGFLATVAFARFVMSRGAIEASGDDQSGATVPAGAGDGEGKSAPVADSPPAYASHAEEENGRSEV